MTQARRPKQSGAGVEEAGAHSPGRSLTQADMVLIAFFRLSGGSTSKVPYEELVIQAWRDYPEAFSLRNHPEHPDASDIHKRLYQTLKSGGLIVSLGNKFFRLTDKGVAAGAALVAAVERAPAPSEQERGRLSRTEQSFIQQAQGSRAFATWRAGQRDQLIDYDARMFFQFSTGTAVGERRRRRDAAKEALEKARRIGTPDATDLAQLANYLSEKFSALFEERDHAGSR